MDHAYFYVVPAGAGEKEKRSHSDAIAERIRFSAESMQQQVFLAGKKNEQHWSAALDAADVLIIAADERSSAQDHAVQEALRAFERKGNRNVILFAKTDALSAELPEQTRFVRETPGAVRDLLDIATTLAKEVSNEEETPEKTETTARGNLKNVLILVGAIFVICVILRLIIFFVKH